MASPPAETSAPSPAEEAGRPQLSLGAAAGGAQQAAGLAALAEQLLSNSTAEQCLAANTLRDSLFSASDIVAAGGVLRLAQLVCRSDDLGVRESATHALATIVLQLNDGQLPEAISQALSFAELIPTLVAMQRSHSATLHGETAVSAACTLLLDCTEAGGAACDATVAAGGVQLAAELLSSADATRVQGGLVLLIHLIHNSTERLRAVRQAGVLAGLLSSVQSASCSDLFLFFRALRALLDDAANPVLSARSALGDGALGDVAAILNCLRRLPQEEQAAVLGSVNAAVSRDPERWRPALAAADLSVLATLLCSSSSGSASSSTGGGSASSGSSSSAPRASQLAAEAALALLHICSTGAGSCRAIIAAGGVAALLAAARAPGQRKAAVLAREALGRLLVAAPECNEAVAAAGAVDTLLLEGAAGGRQAGQWQQAAGPAEAAAAADAAQGALAASRAAHAQAVAAADAAMAALLAEEEEETQIQQAKSAAKAAKRQRQRDRRQQQLEQPPQQLEQQQLEQPPPPSLPPRTAVLPGPSAVETAASGPSAEAAPAAEDSASSPSGSSSSSSRSSSRETKQANEGHRLPAATATVAGPAVGSSVQRQQQPAASGVGSRPSEELEALLQHLGVGSSAAAAASCPTALSPTTGPGPSSPSMAAPAASLVPTAAPAASGGDGSSSGGGSSGSSSGGGGASGVAWLVHPSVFADLRCPITQAAMGDPVVAADGITYERAAIEAWIDRQRAAGQTPTSPLTGSTLQHLVLTPNLAVRSLVASLQAAGLLQSP